MILTFYLPTVIMTHGSVTHGYHFATKEACEKVGKELANTVKGVYKCKQIKN
jgi:hypothetical protein